MEKNWGKYFNYEGLQYINILLVNILQIFINIIEHLTQIKIMKKLFLLSTVLCLFTSCYVHKYSVGTGAEGMKTVTEKQHNFIYGLASGKTPDIQKMADGAEN